jgi:hypothetical protein
MLTAYRYNEDRTLSEVAMAPSLLQLLVAIPYPCTRVWIEDSRHTAQTLIRIDISDVPAHGPAGRPCDEITALMDASTSPPALRALGRQYRRRAIDLEDVADLLDKLDPPQPRRRRRPNES